MLLFLIQDFLIMEINNLTLSKTLHYLIDNFICGFKRSFEQEKIDLTQIYCELVKRSLPIYQNLRSLATHVNATFENSDSSDAKMYMAEKIQELIKNILQQDFLEFAMCTDCDIFTITEEQLHNFLYSGAMTDILSLTPSLSLSQSFKFQLSANDKPTSTEENKNFSCLLPSYQFDSCRLQMESDVSELKRIMENGFSVSDLNSYNVGSLLRCGNFESVSDERNRESSIHAAENFVQPIDNSAQFDSGVFENFDFDDSDDFLSWESCLGNFFPEHLFISEVTPEAAFNSISKQESETYYALLNPLDVVTEEDMVHDIFDLMIGIASDTFYYDIHTRKFRIKSAVHLPNLSPECTARFVSTFLESGSIFYLLQKFVTDFIHTGIVYKGFQQGVHKVLSIYKEHMVTLKANTKSLLSLKKTVVQLSDTLKIFGSICGVDFDKMAFIDIPKGLGLITYLHNVARSHRSDYKVMIAVLLKYAYAPYFSFLNKWLTDGVCNDLFGEFQIMEDANYLSRRDSLFWKFAYTENIDDASRSVPPEIKSYSQRILDCGKNIGLLKICCPNIFLLKFLFCNPPPSLNMVHSFPAVACKLSESLEYVAFKERAEKSYQVQSSDLSIDNFYIEYQASMNRDMIIKMAERRWNILYAAAISRSNIFNLSQVKPVKINNLTEKGTESINSSMLQKWKSLNSLQCSDKDTHFSGKIYPNIGLLFSSCGLNETNLENISEKLNSNVYDLDEHIYFRNFSQSFANKPFSVMEYEKTLVPRVLVSSSSANANALPNLDTDFGRVMKNLCLEEYRNFTGQASSQISNVALHDGETKKVAKNLNPFVANLASLLLSEYGDSIKDISSCLQVTSLQRLLMHNFNTVLNMRVHLVQRTVMEYFIKELKLDCLLSNFRKIYFLQDGIFCQSLCEQLFTLLMRCNTARGFGNWAVLHEILQQALSDSNHQSDPFFAALNVNLTSIPDDEIHFERMAFLRLFVVEYEVEWPLNIIVHPVCQAQYLKIFSTLLEIEFLCWLFGKTWRRLMTASKELHLDDAPQFRDVMLNRFDMEQFLRTIRNSIHQHLQGPLWQFMQKNLSVEESGIDQLENVHMQYLEKALARCFLTLETQVLHEIVSVMFRQMFKFCSSVFECTWLKNVETLQYETNEFARLSSSFKTFKEYQEIFLKRILKETLTKKFGRHWDKDYQGFLDTILAAEKNIP